MQAELLTQLQPLYEKVTYLFLFVVELSVLLSSLINMSRKMRDLQKKKKRSAFSKVLTIYNKHNSIEFCCYYCHFIITINKIELFFLIIVGKQFLFWCWRKYFCVHICVCFIKYGFVYKNLFPIRIVRLKSHHLHLSS